MADPHTALTPETFAPVLAAALGGQVLDLRRSEGGTSRIFWTFDLAVGGGRRPLVALQDAGAGPFFGTRFNMRREAATLAALAQAGTPVPAMHHVSPTGDWMVLDRLPGEAAFRFATAAQRLAAIDDFAQALAALHRLDVRDLPLPYPVAATRREATLADIADYAEAYERLCVHHALVDAAFDWARANVPDDTAAPSVLQGDAGPTNFMHAAGRVTGLIDWELSHCGDPADDLAWVRFRVTTLGFDSDADDWLRAYEAASGTTPDPVKLSYYAVLVTLRCTVANLVRQANAPGSPDTRAARTRAMLAAALAEAGANLPHNETIPS